jgi:hypothetical protein
MESERDPTAIPGNEHFGDSNQRDIATRQVVVEPVGQPTTEYEGWQHFDICVEPSVAAYLRALAGGDLSEGVRIVKKFHEASQNRDK